MTPEERAKEIIAAMLSRSDVEWEISEHIRAAIAEEREECAKVADSRAFSPAAYDTITATARAIAAAIRGRT